METTAFAFKVGLLVSRVFSLNTVVTLGVLMVVRWCSRPCPAYSLLFRDSISSGSSKCISAAQAGAFLHSALVVAPCVFLDLADYFRGMRQGNLALRWSNVHLSWQVQEIGAASLRCADFVGGAVL